MTRVKKVEIITRLLQQDLPNIKFETALDIACKIVDRLDESPSRISTENWRDQK